MAFISLATITADAKREIQKRNGSNLRPVSLPITISIHKQTGKRKSLYLRINADVARKANLRPGDHVDLLVDTKDGCALLHRCDKDHGYKLARSYHYGKGKEFSSLQFVTTYYEGMPYVDQATSIIKYTVDEVGVNFDLPANVRMKP